MRTESLWSAELSTDPSTNCRVDGYNGGLFRSHTWAGSQYGCGILIDAVDTLGRSRFPNDAPVRECVSDSANPARGVWHIILAESDELTIDQTSFFEQQRWDATFVYNNDRVV
jgi:hypothetical protein